MGDFSPKKFIIKAIECHLGLSFPEDNWDKDVLGLAEIDDFLQNPNRLIIYAFIDGKNDRTRLKIVDQVDTHSGKLVVFSKIKPCILTQENLYDLLQITSVYGSPAQALYQSLNNVFAPLLSQTSSPEIQRHVANLQADLRSTILTTTEETSLFSLNSINIVESIQNELEYWENVSSSSKNRLKRTSALEFSDILRTISHEFTIIEALPLNEVEELLESAYGVLDDLWRHEPPYPTERITHLIDIIGNDVHRCVAKEVSQCDIWGDGYITITDVLTRCITLGDKWLESCKQLTHIFWPNCATNLWKGEPYEPVALKKLVERLKEVLNIQTLLRQLTRLLTPQERDELGTQNMFQHFRALNFLEFGQFSDNLWLKACKQFEYLLKPAEEKVAVKLKKQLSTVNANTRQLLHEFSRYSALIARPIVKNVLLAERQHLLTLLFDYVRLLQSQSNSENHINVKLDTPQIITDVVAAKQLEAQANDILLTSTTLLQDLTGFDSLHNMVTELIKDLKHQHTDLFESWTREIFQIQNELTLKESEPVVQFSTDNLMCVNYSQRLVPLVSEVRHFKALGYRIPSEIEAISETAKKFMKLARVLEQIANFHNTIGHRMINCQRPMMLSSALELSNLVQKEEVVLWEDTKAVKNYVETLKGSVEKLSKQNNMLAAHYYQINDQITSLAEVDFLKDFDKWKMTLKAISKILSVVEDKGFRHMQTWKLEIDSSLCQLLEKQYLKSLDTIHLNIDVIYTHIIYRKNELQFSPDKTRLMELYQQKLQLFLDRPKTFRGVSDNTDIFKEIIKRNEAALTKVEQRTSELFGQLDDVLKHWQNWLQLDSIDVSKLTVWQNWDLHFRASKTFGQEIAKLPSTEEKIGCFLIGLSLLRSDLESHNRSCWDQLVMSLKDSIAGDVFRLQNYVDPATAVLIKQPLTLQEIGESGAAHGNILKQATEMEECYNQMLKKSQTLSSWTREQVDSVNRLKGAWERLQSLLDNHQHIIARQMETIKTTLNIEKENLEKEIERFGAKWEQSKPKPGEIAEKNIEELYEQLTNIKEKNTQWLELMEKQAKLIGDYDKYNIPQSDFVSTKLLVQDLERAGKTWSLFEEFFTDLNSLSNEDWIVFRKKTFKFEEFLKQWLLKVHEGDELQMRILQEIHKYEDIVGSLKYIKGDDFTEKHWMDVLTLLQMPLKPIDELKFGDFLKASENFITSTKDLEIICKRAACEIVVRQALAELDQWDVQARFILTPHIDSRKTEIMLVKDFKEILNTIGDNQSLLQSVKNSADYENFSERAAIWENKLVMLEQNLTHLALIQRKWVYLEPIFTGGTLVQEKSRFEKIDKDFHQILGFIQKDQRVSALCRYHNLSAILKNLQEQLNRCQKSLDDFLAEKRKRFPRFLFLGDDDLLEVVGQASKEQVIQTHLKKLFAGIYSIHLSEDGTKIVAICSAENEVVLLSNTVPIIRPVEDWLNALVKEMQKTLKELLVDCLKEGQGADPLKYPSQILCLADQITFTLKVEQGISTMTLPPLLAFYKAQLSHYSSLELNLEQENSLELKLKSLLLDTMHHIDVLNELLDSNITKVDDWLWQKQLRFYSNSTGEITVKMANARMEYAYEYQGNAPKLVRTPLTDRCFLTLTQGMHLGMGGNPYGPAGTGKTESVKALGGFLGRQVLVFNCDEGIDANAMGRILSGLVLTGAWGCFDEFNRLDEATLSAISMQIQPIQKALSSNLEKLTLLDQEIVVNRHCGIFVTLNPAGGNYGGRNMLPDNLKQLFRPVVMTQPDHEQIVRTLLHCDGYHNADVIARKLIEIFDVSAKLLSKQQHYDWGLRAIRSILIGCGRALKEHRKTTEEAEGNQFLVELTLVVRVLRMDILSKLTFADSLKFDELIKDVFNTSVEDMGNEILVKALNESCHELHLEVNHRQIEKCVELHEQIKQRMGVAIVGPPSSGKSSVRNLLFHALKKLGTALKQHVFNPKSMHKTELLGQIDLDTRQWSDGVLTLYSLQVTSENAGTTSWIVCDGNIDPEWVESLNSVLDDNRLLSLPSGWRIQFGPNVNFIFETHDLSRASPATISRMGIVLLSQEDLDLTCYITNFLQNQTEEFESNLGLLINEYFLKSVDWIYNEAETTIHTPKIAIARTGLSQLFGVYSKNQFAVSLVNGLGAQLEEDFREVFAQQVFEWMSEIPPHNIARIRYNKDRDIIDSYYTNANINLEIVSKNIPLVFTGDVIKHLETLKTWLLPKNEQNFLLIGPHGAAKTLILEHLVKERSDMELATIHCSANLGPNYVITKIAQLCLIVNTNKGKVYKPKKGHLLLYFKNLHLLKSDKWGSNMLIEFLHQMITYKAFFDHSLEVVGFENITIVGSMSKSNSLSTRFTSIVHSYSLSLPEPDDISVILVAYLQSLLKWVKIKTVKLATTMIAVYDKLRTVFHVTNYKHYDFSPHDLTNWASSFLCYQTNDSETNVLEVFCYEAVRCFGDKLTSEEDRNKLDHILNEAFKSHWGLTNIVSNIKNKYYVCSTQFSVNDDTKLHPMPEEEWCENIKRGITQFARDGEYLDILINKELLHLTSSLAKILSSSGNVVMIGRSGIGRKSGLKVISALKSARLIICSPNQHQLQSDLKSAIQYAGLEAEQVYLLLEDYIFTQKTLLSSINILMCAGEVPNLYNPAELDSMILGLKEEAGRENFEGNLIDFFRQRIMRCLHIIACIDVDNEHIWDIFEQCPAFLHKSTIIWKTEWISETIQSTPTRMIEQLEIEKSKNFPKIYDTMREKMAAPSRFIAMIRLYIIIFSEKKTAITSKQNKLSAGVNKLNEARNLVADLKQKAGEQEKLLAEKQAKANGALDMISSTMKNASSHKEEMEVLKQQTEEENRQLTIRKREIESELEKVEPMIQEARSAVGNIKPESLSEIRSLRAPPEIIRDILEGVLRLMGIQDTSWNSMKTFLAKRGVKEEIRSFDASRIVTENRQAVERLMEKKSDSFDPKSAKRASVAAAPLAAWVAANVKYSHVAEKIKPLEREQNKLKDNLANAQTQLGELSAGLSDVDTTVAKLKLQLSAFTKEAAEIEIDLNRAQETLASAEDLINKLEDEYRRWKLQLTELSDQLKELPDHCSVAAAFITYLSGEHEDGREMMLEKWSKELGIAFNLEQFLSTEREHLQWQSEGLSYDNLSLQNAIIILKTKITPLLIDPTLNATDWFKNHFKHQSIESTTQDAVKFTTNLELAVRFGKILIIEQLESVSAILLPLLRQEFVFQGERKLIYLNGKLIDYHKDFRLVLSSRNENIKIPAEVSAILATLNFTVTRAGLTEQLLSATIRQENPELEENQKQVLREREELQEKQFQLQNRLLEDLANSSGDILQNANLLASLNETKASSSAIAKALEESVKIQAKLRTEYDVYKEISLFGSYLYFACSEFSKFNILYVISVQAFIKLFLRSLQTFQGIQSGVDLQKQHLFQTCYDYVSRGIMKMDRLTFAMHLLQKLFKIPPSQWNYFLGNTVINKEHDDVPNWIPKRCIQQVQNMQSCLPELYSILDFDQYHHWKKFMASDFCEKEFPHHCKITDFERVLVIQALRPDRTVTAMTQCVLQMTRLSTIDPAVLNLSHILKESSAGEPILILTAPGTDPSSEIRELNQSGVVEVAMGEGQEHKALSALAQTAKDGNWLVLKNLHLVPNWLGILNQNLQHLDRAENFRLWLITEPSQTFNFVLARSCLKVVVEAPQGVKHNLQRTYNHYGDQFLEKLHTASARIFFVLACIHAILQERRTYVPQGWSKWYEFSDTDLHTCVKLVEEFWQNSRVPWKFIFGLCCDAIYGGRIENVDDIKILETYLRQYLTDEVLSHRWSPFGGATPPSSNNYFEYLKFLKMLPDRDPPSYFGLPGNIGRAWEQQISNKVRRDLKKTSFSGEVSLKFDRESWAKTLAPFMILWKRLNQNLDFVRTVLGQFETKRSPVENFINEEFCSGIVLVQKIHKNFASLNRICKGAAIPNEDDFEVANALIQFQVPKKWQTIWQGPRDPHKYLSHIITKTTNVAKMREVKSEKLLQNPLNLSQFLHPGAFISSYKQEFSRLNNIPMDELDLESSWTQPPPKNCLILSELLVEGGIFEGGQLKPCVSHSESINAAPQCYLTWKEKVKDGKYLNGPLYYASNRENQLMFIQVPCDLGEKDRWIQAGLAFYLEY